MYGGYKIHMYRAMDLIMASIMLYNSIIMVLWCGLCYMFDFLLLHQAIASKWKRQLYLGDKYQPAVKSSTSRVWQQMVRTI